MNDGMVDKRVMVNISGGSEFVVGPLIKNGHDDYSVKVDTTNNLEHLGIGYNQSRSGPFLYNIKTGDIVSLTQISTPIKNYDPV